MSVTINTLKSGEIPAFFVVLQEYNVICGIVCNVRIVRLTKLIFIRKVLGYV